MRRWALAWGVLAVATTYGCAGISVPNPASDAVGALNAAIENLSGTPPTQADPTQPIKIDGVRFDPDFANNGKVVVRFSAVDAGKDLTQSLKPEAVKLELRVYKPKGLVPTPPPFTLKPPSLGDLGNQLGLPGLAQGANDLAASAGIALPDTQSSTAEAGGAPVDPDLIPADMQVTLPPPPPPLHLGVAIDASGSMTKTDPDRLRVKALKALVTSLRETDKVSITYFGIKQAKKSDPMIKLAIGFDGGRDAVLKAIEGVPAEGATPLYDGAYQVIDQVAKLDGAQARAVLVLTDGTDNASTKKAADVIARAKEKDVLLVMLAFANFREAELQDMVGKAGGVFLGNPNGKEVGDLVLSAGRALLSTSASATIVIPPGRRNEKTYSGTLQVGFDAGKTLLGGFNLSRVQP